jgi:Transcriptional regulator, AbiEi antitoxin
MRHHPETSRLLRQQFGIITMAQLQATGMSSRTISRDVAAGELAKVLPGVLCSSEHRVGFEAKSMAAQLWLGDTGALSGPTAARHYGLRNMDGESTWARTSLRSRGEAPAWFRREFSPWLFECAEAVRLHRGWRVLAPVPMLVTLAELFNDHRFERAAEDAWHLRLITPETAAAHLDEYRGRGRRGIARVQRWLDRAGERSLASQSGFELDVLDAVRRAGLPEPARQHPVRLLTDEIVHLDLAWPDAKLAVEPGHTWWHGGDLRMSADYARDRACGLVGWHVMRYEESSRSNLAGLGAEVAAMYRQRLDRHRH